MRILFATSFHPAELSGGTGGCLQDYLRELRKRADVRCVVFDWDGARRQKPDADVECVVEPQLVLDVFAPESRFIEAAASLRTALSPLLAEFRPEVIHCADAPAFLPFRFDRNVLYAAGIAEGNPTGGACAPNRPKSCSLRAAIFRDARIERCAVTGSAVLTVPSNFAAENAERLAGGMCCPIVLPPGLSEQRRAAAHSGGSADSDAARTAGTDAPRTVAFFGRLDDARSGVNDFIYAVNHLGERFKRRNSIRYELHGGGSLPFGLDSPLLDEKTGGGAAEEALRRADIVVLPYRDAAFGTAALEAMASGALVLLPPGFGMDSFAEPEANCIPISRNYFEIADAIQDAVERFGQYQFMRDNARRTARGWSMGRCVRAYLAVYREICCGRIPQLCSAYRKESRSIIDRYRTADDVEKAYCAEQERRAAFEALRPFVPPEEPQEEWNCHASRKTLVLTGVYAPDADDLPEHITVVPTLDEQQDGIIVRPECLPFRDGEFENVVAVGALESASDPCGALVEMQRVAKSAVIVLQYKGTPHAWQAYRMEDDGDWKQLSGSGWSCTVCHEEAPADAAAVPALPALAAAPFLRPFSAARYARIGPGADAGGGAGISSAGASESGGSAADGGANFGGRTAGRTEPEEPAQQEPVRSHKSVLHGIAVPARTGNPLPYQIVVYSRRACAAAAGTPGGTA